MTMTKKHSRLVINVAAKTEALILSRSNSLNKHPHVEKIKYSPDGAPFANASQKASKPRRKIPENQNNLSLEHDSQRHVKSSVKIQERIGKRIKEFLRGHISQSTSVGHCTENTANSRPQRRQGISKHDP